MRRARALSASAALVAIVVIAIPVASPGATGPNGETLTLRPDCNGYPQFQGLQIELSGFQPNMDVVGRADFPDGGHIGPQTVQTDADGRFSIGLEDTRPGTWTVSITWPDGALSESLYVNCGGPNGSLGIDPIYQLDFPPQEVGHFSAPEQVTLTNYGPGVMTVTKVGLEWADQQFLVASDSCTDRPVKVGETCFIRVRFGPASVGSSTNYLRIRSSATDSAYLKALSGTGIPNAVPEAGPRIDGSVEPASVPAGVRSCFEFQAHSPAGRPVAGALVRFAGQKTHADADGKAELCGSFPYPGTRTARIRKHGYHSVLLRIKVLR